jgi:hypothetical protein
MVRRGQIAPVTRSPARAREELKGEQCRPDQAERDGSELGSLVPRDPPRDQARDRAGEERLELWEPWEAVEGLEGGR